jgi:hypothetical protein
VPTGERPFERIPDLDPCSWSRMRRLGERLPRPIRLEAVEAFRAAIDAL